MIAGNHRGARHRRTLTSTEAIEDHLYTVDVILVGAEPFPCIICGQPRQHPAHSGRQRDAMIGTADGLERHDTTDGHLP